ncbi:kinesin k39 [Diplodia corticola]|uniref:Kinesin k39 n=1 Tax=Diplodia corticola TaxID=236234 RepID=A0A1J9R123_9PEZI|nr:kinesin k39 [Diplodia corticola]OJD33938.1 kinesin k39 [Diplodia corticola]
MGPQETLTAEVERVVSAPYAVCLKRLHDILIECNPLVVQAWADASACQLAPLARCVRKAFDTWNYTLDIFERLVLARPFRDAFLAQYPSMLDAFLQKALTPEGPSAVTGTCVAMLSEPLPHSVPLPFTAQEFFMRLFDEAMKSTDEHHVSTIYKLLDGACRDLLGILPEDRIKYIEEKGYELLKSSAANPSHAPNETWHRLQILSLGLMGILAQTCDPHLNAVAPVDMAVGNIPSEASLRGNSLKHVEEIPRMFQTRGARATIRLTVMVAIGMLSTHEKGLDDDLARYLKIVAEVLSIMPPSARQKFLDDDGKFVSKLVEKVQKAGDHPGVQLQGLLSIALLHEGRTLPESAVSAYTRALLAARHLPGNVRAFSDAARISLPLFAAQLNEDFVRNFLCCSIEATEQVTSRVGELQWLRLLGKHLDDVAQETPAVRRYILLTLSSDCFQGHLQKLLSLSVANTGIHQTGEGSCRCHALASSMALGLETCSLLLRTAIMAQTDEIGIHTRVGLDLLQKQQELASSRTPVCEHLRSNQETTPPLSFLQEKCTPHTQSESRDWRERLAREVEVQERNRLELIERRMGEVCRDLEARCEQVEEPLRLEQLKVQELEEKLRTLKEQHGELATHASNLENREVDREFFVQGLEAEKIQAEQDCQRASDAKDDLAKRTEDLQRKLDHANQTAETTLNSARQDYDRMKSELCALLTKEETRYEEQAATLNQMKAHIISLEDDLDSAQEHLEQEQKGSEELRATLDDALQHIEEQKLAKLQAQAEVSDLLEKEAAYIDQLRQAQVALIESRSTSAELKAEHDALLESSTAEIESVRKQADLDLHRVVEEASNEREAMDSHLQLAKEEIDCLIGDKEDLSAALQAKETHIEKLEGKVENMTKARNAAEARLNELESWRNNILSAMGAPTGGMLENATVSHRHQGSRPGPTSPPNLSRRRTYAEFETNVDHGLEEDPDRTESERTQSPGESRGTHRTVSASPTPKRAKIQRQQPFKLPILKAATSTSADAKRHSTRLSQGHRMSTAARKPLDDVSAERGNVSPVRKSVSGAKNASLENAPPTSTRSAKQASQFGGSFDVSEFLEGTPFTPSGRRPQHLDIFGSGSTTVDV